MEKTKEWFGVKSVIRHKKDDIKYLAYEERVVLFLATDFDKAIEQAEKEVIKLPLINFIQKL